jgi:hypothetical protein
MNSENKNNDCRTEPVASALTKRPWHAPEIEEVDLAETQLNGGSGGDLGNQSS